MLSTLPVRQDLHLFLDCLDEYSQTKLLSLGFLAQIYPQMINTGKACNSLEKHGDNDNNEMCESHAVMCI